MKRELEAADLLVLIMLVIIICQYRTICLKDETVTRQWDLIAKQKQIVTAVLLETELQRQYISRQESRAKNYKNMILSMPLEHRNTSGELALTK
jgi:hypothetical protein